MNALWDAWLYFCERALEGLFSSWKTAGRRWVYLGIDVLFTAKKSTVIVVIRNVMYSKNSFNNFLLLLNLVNQSFVISKVVDRRAQITWSLEIRSYLQVPQCLATKISDCNGTFLLFLFKWLQNNAQHLENWRCYKGNVHVNMKPDR